MDIMSGHEFLNLLFCLLVVSSFFISTLYLVKIFFVLILSIPFPGENFLDLIKRNLAFQKKVFAKTFFEAVEFYVLMFAIAIGSFILSYII